MSDPTETGLALEEMDAPGDTDPVTGEKTAADLEAIEQAAPPGATAGERYTPQGMASLNH